MRVVLTPPDLPAFLADTFELKTIEGVPTDEEVKTIHGAIRALDGVLNVPRLYDIDLAMRLSQYLFSVQMMRYREQHPMIVFPTKITHTPPTLPAHISVDLKPVSGSPSDAEVKNVQEALRMSENLSTVPSMFDAGLSMKLSQHLFNIQFERYMHEVFIGFARGGGHSKEHNTPYRLQIDPADTQSEIPNSVDSYIERSNNLGGRSSTSGSVEEDTKEEVISSPGAEFRPREQTKGETEETNRLLVRLGDKMDDLKRFLVGAQHSMAMGWNATSYSSKYQACHHGLVSERGKIITRWSYGYDQQLRTELSTQSANEISDSNLLAYLQLQGIEKEFVSEGANPTLIQDKRAEAIAALRLHLGI